MFDIFKFDIKQKKKRQKQVLFNVKQNVPFNVKNKVQFEVRMYSVFWIWFNITLSCLVWFKIIFLSSNL